MELETELAKWEKHAPEGSATILKHYGLERENTNALCPTAVKIAALKGHPTGILHGCATELAWRAKRTQEGAIQYQQPLRDASGK